MESAADSASLRGRSGSPCCFQLTHPDNWRGRSHSRQSSRNPNRKPASSVARGSRLGSRMRLTEVEPLGGRRCKAGGATRPELADAPRGRAEEPTERGRRPQAPSTDLSIQGPCASPGFADVRRLTRVLATILDRASPLRTRLADSCRRRHGRLEKQKRKEGEKKKGDCAGTRGRALGARARRGTGGEELLWWTQVQSWRRYSAGTRGRATGTRRGTDGAWPTPAGPEHGSFDPGPLRITGFPRAHPFVHPFVTR